MSTVFRKNNLFPLLSTALMLAATFYFGWTIPDLFMSLWISSLFVGLPTLVIWIISMSLHGTLLSSKEEEPEERRSLLKGDVGEVVRIVFIAIVLYRIFGVNLYVNAFLLLNILQFVISFLHLFENEGFDPKQDPLTAEIAVRNFCRALPGTILVLFLAPLFYGTFLNGYAFIFRSFFRIAGFPDTSFSLSWFFSNILHFSFELGKVYWPVIVASVISQAGNLILAVSRPFDQRFSSPFKSIAKMHIIIMAMGILAIFGAPRLSLLIVWALFFFPVEDLLFRTKEIKEF